jgi:hypothetical protein
MNNGKKGPSVETFVGAVEGLGLSVSAFFAGLGDVVPPVPVGSDEYTQVVERLIGLEALVHSLVAVWSSSSASSALSSVVNASDVGGGGGVVAGGAHADPTVHDGARELERVGQLATLLGAAQAAGRASRQGVAGSGGADGIARRGGGAHAAGRAGRRRKFKETA